MTPEQILAIPARVLSQSQREAYFNDGFIILEKVIGDTGSESCAMPRTS